MTTIAWDGKTLAADRRCNIGSYLVEKTKIERVGSCLLGYSGSVPGGELLLNWWKAGNKPDEFPREVSEDDLQARLLVVMPSGEVWLYDRGPHPLKMPPQKVAIGSGCDFAMAAMYLGKTSKRAVEVACALDPNSGDGIDTLCA